MSKSQGTRDFTVNSSSNVRDAMSLINENGIGIVFVISEGNIIGSLTDGDIRRYILSGGDIQLSVKGAMNENPHLLSEKESDNIPRNIIPNFGNIMVPIIDENKKIIDIKVISSAGESVSLKDNPSEFKETRSVNSVAIIGGAGYLGSVLSRLLLSQGYRVSVLDNLLYGSQGIDNLIENENFIHINGSMDKISDIVKTIRDADAVVHLGAIVGDPASEIDPSNTLSINLHSTKIVADVCKFYNINRFIFASTCSVYGKSDGSQGITEEAPMNPVSLYARTKIESEKILISMTGKNFSPTILRFSTLFGLSQRMRFDLVVNVLCAKAYFDNKITIFGGEQYRPMLSTHDASRSIIACLKSPLKNVSGEVFNVGNSNLNYKIIEIGRAIKEKLPSAAIEITKDDVDTRDYNVNFDKIKRLTNFSTEVSLQEGIETIIEAFEKGNFKDYNNKVYSNYLSLSD